MTLKFKMPDTLKILWAVGMAYAIILAVLFLPACESRLEVSCSKESYSGPKIDYRRYGVITDQERKEMIDFCKKETDTKNEH